MLEDVLINSNITRNTELHQNPLKKEVRKKLVDKEVIDDDIRPLMEKEYLLPDEREKVIKRLRTEMKEAAKALDFETAALLRDKIRYIQQG